MNNDTFYQLSAESLNHQPVDFADFHGKAVLVVNTASKCGFTPQFEGLEKLYKTHGDNGLVILGFPCNQFLNQEPGDEGSIQNGCMLNYGVTFPMFAKIDVNGSDTHPVFAWLKHRLRGRFGSKRVKWNFTKFLVDRSGQPVKRYAPTTTPEEIEADIVRILENR